MSEEIPKLQDSTPGQSPTPLRLQDKVCPGIPLWEHRIFIPSDKINFKCCKFSWKHRREPTRAQEKPTPEPTSNAVPTRAQEEPTPEPTSNAVNVHRNIAGAQNSPTPEPTSNTVNFQGNEAGTQNSPTGKYITFE